MDKAVRLAMVGKLFEMDMHNRACKFEENMKALAKCWSEEVKKPHLINIWGEEHPHDFFFASRKAFKEEISLRFFGGKLPQGVSIGGGEIDAVSLNHPEDAAFWRIVSLRYRLRLDHLDDAELRERFAQQWEERKANDWSPMF